MIEIPESHTIAEQLGQTLKGKTIQNVTPGTSPHKFAWFFGDPELYHDRLQGKTVGGATAYAGYVEICCDEMRIVFHDGVNLRYFRPGEPLPKKHQLHIEFTDFSSLVAIVQMYGGLLVFRAGENDNPYYLVAKEKPSPLSDRFDFGYFTTVYENTGHAKLSAKAFLATKQRFPGVGNGVLQDILWRAGINPKTRMLSLDAVQFRGLFDALCQTLGEMTLRGGRDTERDLFGCYGGYPCVLSKNTRGNPCPNCGSPIARTAYLGGNVYFCSSCQPYSK